MSRVRLVMVPGLGGDHQMFGEQRKVFPFLEVPERIAAVRGESLRAYALRLAGTIDPAGPMVLCGASLGGMLALEMAGVLRPRCVVLMGSCRSPAAIKPWLRVVARLGAMTPAGLGARFKSLAMAAGWLLGPIGFAERRVVVKMARTASVEFVLWGLGVIPRWEGVEHVDVPVVMVHGRADRIIRASRVKADVMVEDAGHLVNMSHAGEVNRVIEEWLGS